MFPSKLGEALLCFAFNHNYVKFFCAIISFMCQLIPELSFFTLLSQQAGHSPSFPPPLLPPPSFPPPLLPHTTCIQSKAQ